MTQRRIRIKLIPITFNDQLLQHVMIGMRSSIEDQTVIHISIWWKSGWIVDRLLRSDLKIEVNWKTMTFPVNWLFISVFVQIWSDSRLSRLSRVEWLEPLVRLNVDSDCLQVSARSGFRSLHATQFTWIHSNVVNVKLIYCYLYYYLIIVVRIHSSLISD